MDFNIHGLGFKVLSKNPKFLDYLSFRFLNYTSKVSDAELIFEINFSKKADLELSKWDRLSSNVFVNARNLLIKYNNLSIIYDLSEKPVRVRAFFHPQKLKHLGRLLLKGIKNTYNDYFEYFIIRKVIQNTLFYWLYKKQGFESIHAAGVNCDGRASLFFGLGGIGKTTLALKLVHSQNMRFLGDNFIFVKKNRVYPFLEPIRMTEFTNKALGFKIKNEDVKTFGKSNMYLPPKYLSNEPCKIKNVFFPIISEKEEIKKITQQEAISRINTVMRVLKETYHFYEVSLLSFIDGTKITFDKDLLNNVNFYELRYKDLNKVYDLIKNKL